MVAGTTRSSRCWSFRVGRGDFGRRMGGSFRRAGGVPCLVENVGEACGLCGGSSSARTSAGQVLIGSGPTLGAARLAGSVSIRHNNRLGNLRGPNDGQEKQRRAVVREDAVERKRALLFRAEEPQ